MPNTHVMRTIVVAVILAAATRASADIDVTRQGHIDRAIRSYAFLTVFDDVQANIDGEGVVVLSGYVTALAKRQGIMNRVSVVNGVVGVRNDVAVLPTSLRDTQLRFYLARAIYTSSALGRYASSSYPPVRIVVDGGRVTLRGVVATTAERSAAVALAEIIAAGVVESHIRLASDVGVPLALD